MKYKFDAYEVALLLLDLDLSIGSQKEFLENFWGNHFKEINTDKYHSKYSFLRSISEYIVLFSSSTYDIEEYDLLMKDIGFDQKNEEAYMVVTYFKYLMLSLLYDSKKGFRKIKLRTLLKKFGYSRRSAKLVSEIQYILNDLSIKTYLKGYTPCSISDIDIDDMIIFRLEQVRTSKLQSIRDFIKDKIIKT